MFVVISWNVLADAYIRADFYPRTNPAVLRPGARTGAIVDAIAASGADLVCLQEAEPALIAHARARLAGWSIEYANKRGKPDGVALLSRTTLAAVRTLAFADGAPDRADSGHVALLARCGALCVATTHLRWDRPGTPAEARWAVREVRELLGALDDAPWLVCGDLNVEPGDLAYAMLQGAGFLDPCGPEPTANPNGRAKRIDHILVRGLAATPLPVVAIDDETPLPSPAMPSDHVPIGVRIDQ